MGLEDGVPQLLSGHGLFGATLLLVLVEKGPKLVAVDLVKSRGFSGAEERPVAALLYALHEEIGDPKGEEQVTSTDLLLAMVLAQVEEFKNVGVPRFEVNREGSRALVASLIDVAGRVVVDSEHGNDTVRIAVGSRNVGSGSADVVNAETDAAGSLGDESACFEGIVNALDRVVLHGHEEARRQLRMRSSGVEESRRSVGEVTLRHEVVRLQDAVDVRAVNSDSDTHEHVLRSLSDLAIDAKKVRSLECLEAEVVLKGREESALTLRIDKRE